MTHSFLEPVQRGFAKGHQTRAQSSWESTRPASDCSNFLRASAAAGTPKHPSCGLHTPSSPRPTEQVDLNKPLLLPALVWVGNRRRREAYKQRQAPGAAQARGKELAPAAAGAADKIPVISEAVDSGGNCGLWEQVQAGVRPDLSRS